MLKLNDLDCSITYTAQNKVRMICRPLIAYLPIRGFKYTRMYSNGLRFVLSMNNQVSDYLYKQGNYKQTYFESLTLDRIKEGIFLWGASIQSTLLPNHSLTLINDIKILFNIHHGIVIVEKQHDYCEIYDFVSKDSTIHTCDLHLLKRFIIYFKCEAQKLIKQGMQERFYLPAINAHTINDKTISKEKIEKFTKLTEVKRVYLSEKFNHSYITKRELEMVEWLIRGKTAAEISMILGISQRTIEHHLENLKYKLGCSKLIQIPFILKQLDII